MHLAVDAACAPHIPRDQSVLVHLAVYKLDWSVLGASTHKAEQGGVPAPIHLNAARDPMLCPLDKIHNGPAGSAGLELRGKCGGSGARQRSGNKE